MHEAVLRARPAVWELYGRPSPADRGGAGSGGVAVAGSATDVRAVRPVQGARERMHCGLCGGGVRGYRGILHGRPIADWKHTDVPPGTTPHRPILGTPVDAETLDRIHRAPRIEEKPKREPKPQATVVKTSPASADMLLESQSITSVLKLADLEGWAVVQRLYRELDDGTEYLILKFRRRDLGAVALWTRDKKDAWSFDDGWSLTPKGARQVTSTSLKTWIKTRDEECPECGCSSITHIEGECP